MNEQRQAQIQIQSLGKNKEKVTAIVNVVSTDRIGTMVMFRLRAD